MMPTDEWTLVLTGSFALSYALCLCHMAQCHRAQRLQDPNGTRTGRLLDVNHALMSVGMIAMLWIPLGPLTTLVQVILFAGFAVILPIRAFRHRERDRGHQTAGSVVLNAAMVWMLVSMLLRTSSDAHNAKNADTAIFQHRGHERAHQQASPPPAGEVHPDVHGHDQPVSSQFGWVDATDAAFALMYAAVLVINLLGIRRYGGNAIHFVAQAVMALGMGAALYLMPR